MLLYKVNRESLIPFQMNAANRFLSVLAPRLHDLFMWLLYQTLNARDIIILS